MKKIIQLDQAHILGGLSWNWVLRKYELRPVTSAGWARREDQYLFFRWINIETVSRELSSHSYGMFEAECSLYSQDYKDRIAEDEVFVRGEHRVYDGKIKKLSPIEALAYWATIDIQPDGAPWVLRD